MSADAERVSLGLSKLHLRVGEDLVKAGTPIDIENLRARHSMGPSASTALAGMEEVLEELREVIGWPLLYAEEAAALGVRWPRGILLHGPPGVGKSAAVAAVAAEFGATLHLVTASTVFGAYTGESEQRLRAVFAAAAADAAAGRPAVIFLDEVDTLCPKREAGRQHEARVVGQLLTLMDGAESGAQRQQRQPPGSTRRLGGSTEGSTGGSVALGLDRGGGEGSRRGSTGGGGGSIVPNSSNRPHTTTRSTSSTRTTTSSFSTPIAPSTPSTPLAALPGSSTPAPLAAALTPAPQQRHHPPGSAALFGGNGKSSTSAKAAHVVVVAATCRPNAVDPALRRAGRLDREVAVGLPGQGARVAILRRMAGKIPLAGDVQLERLAERCHGYSGADLTALCREAAMAAIAAATPGLTAVPPPAQAPPQPGAPPALADASHVAGAAGVGGDGHPQQQQQSQQGSQQAQQEQSSHQLELPPVGWVHFQAAMAVVGPSVARGAAKEFPPAHWDDIGGLDSVKKQLQQSVEWPILHSAAFSRMGLRPPRGVLLHGPPGCAKTTLARAAATASHATFIPLSGTQLYSKYVGEGEEALREAFRRARLAAPSIVFVDELDSLVGKRGEASGSGSASGSASGRGANDVSSRILATFLTEMDGMEAATGVLVLATTNRPQAIDSALLRPGRFDSVVYVPPPDQPGRLAALKVHTRGMPLAADVDLASLAQRTPRYTGAELAAVCREAALAAVREDEEGAEVVAGRHFEAALAGVRATLGEAELARYAAWPAG